MITFLSDLLSLLIRHSKYESISVVNPTKRKKKRHHANNDSIRKFRARLIGKNLKKSEQVDNQKRTTTKKERDGDKRSLIIFFLICHTLT